MTLHFMRNATENDYSLHHLEVFLPASDFPSDSKLSKKYILLLTTFYSKKKIFLYIYTIFLKNIKIYINFFNFLI